MPISLDPDRSGNRAQALALLALRTQVRILTTLWPMQAWAVFDQLQGDAALPLVARGFLRGIRRQRLDAWLATCHTQALFGLNGAKLHQVVRSHEPSSSDASAPLAAVGSRLVCLPLWVPGRTHASGLMTGLLPDDADGLPAPDQMATLSWSLEAMALALAQWEESGELNSLVRNVRREACLDHLTRVLNRRGWDICVQRLERSDGPDRAVIMLDLDDLKRVNDLQGHATGDALLQRTAQVLRAVLRGDDVIARLGGDEFGLLIAPGVTAASLARFAARIREALEQAKVQVSLGAALQSEAGHVQDALALADQRMYQDKQDRLGVVRDRRSVATPGDPV
ncbi:GGDEF domain-containing protein [Castellaniella sp.]|uniref:GGDEF domain-containing protein n=1 Tax=Castellaniella sp. TaxID=1955812 RepID=UPI002AFEFF46|nr:GGDEF domain-containing protein [Castellaniella sp.]